MKKLLSVAAALLAAFSLSIPAMAAPVLDNSGALKNTVTGFDGGLYATKDLTLMGGAVSVPFGLGENGTSYNVEFTFNEGGEYLSASYSRSKNAITLSPKQGSKLMDSREYELEISVFDRGSLSEVAKGFTLTGEISYDNVQIAEDGYSYRNMKGVLYDFSGGVKEVTIDTGDGVRATLHDGASGIINMEITRDSNKSLDYMFSLHNLSYINFAGKPRISGSATVSIDGDEGLLLYSYSGGKLKKVRNASYEDGAYTFKTNSLETFILSNAPLNEGSVDEDRNTVR